MGGATRFLMLLTTNTAPSPLLPSLRRLSRHGCKLLPLTLLPSSHNRRQSSSVSIHRPLKINASQQQQQQQQQQLHTQTISAAHRPAHPWPELSNFINNLANSGYFNRQSKIDEELIDIFNLPDDFIGTISACVAFAREKPHLLGMLSRRDIVVVVDKGIPFLFKNGDDSKRRLTMSFRDNNVQNADGAETVDLMKFLLSYASSLVSSEMNNLPVGELESSVRHLFHELAQLSYTPQTNIFGSVQNQFADRYGQASVPLVQNVEMKRGDWICPRCSFMNFARNMKCLECHEKRPKRQFSGGEWECPQCDFFNYGRNTACLRCDCKRPGELSFGTTNSGSGLGYGNGSNMNQADVDRRLAENEEKAQRWFSKISQMESNSDMSNAIADEDFPEIMPLRKGVNRFVVSTRKTPLERRLGNAENRRNLGYSGNLGSIGANMTANESISQGMDKIHGHKATASPSDDKTSYTGKKVESSAFFSASNSTLPQHNAPRGSNYVPFVPLPADMFAKKPDKSQLGKSEVEMDGKSLASCTDEKAISESSEYKNSSDKLQPCEKSTGQNLSDENETEQDEKTQRWFKRVAELHNVTDLASEIADEDFPEIMPMRKGENRFVVGKRKDRSLTSPMYKRRMANEQANDSNFVPFVPFPPNYFAQKGNQLSGAAVSSNNAASGNSISAAQGELLEKLDNQQHSTGSLDSRPWQNSNESVTGSSSGDLTSGSSAQNVVDPQPNTRTDSWSNGYSRNENVGGSSNFVGSSTQNYASPTSGRDGTNNASHNKEGVPSENRNIRDSWSGKSLEGSAVKEPDPLDMSEEAKAERWFRRVAQIKDISELSQIPDEDFPSIMPMRKGVNRFVVSKRKTPLERRLTSTQYRRNLPTVNSDPEKGGDSN